MLSFGFRIFCWYRGFCHRTGSDLLLFLYIQLVKCDSVGQYPMYILYIYTFVLSRAFMASAASQAEDADSSRAPGSASALQGSMNVHHGTLWFVSKLQCISSVFY